MNCSSAATLGRVNWRKLWITVVVVYVVNRGLALLIHRVWLGETYRSLGHIWPLEMYERQWIPFVTVAVWCFFFVYLFAKGCEGKGLAEGARFGAGTASRPATHATPASHLLKGASGHAGLWKPSRRGSGV